MVATLNVMSNEDSSPGIRISCHTKSPFIYIHSTEHHTQTSIHRCTSHGSGVTAEDLKGEVCKVTLFVTTCVTAATSSSSARPAVATPMMLYPFVDSLAS